MRKSVLFDSARRNRKLTQFTMTTIFHKVTSNLITCECLYLHFYKLYCLHRNICANKDTFLAQIFSLFACKDQIFITTCAKTVPVLQGL